MASPRPDQAQGLNHPPSAAQAPATRRPAARPEQRAGSQLSTRVTAPPLSRVTSVVERRARLSGRRVGRLSAPVVRDRPCRHHASVSPRRAVEPVPLRALQTFARGAADRDLSVASGPVRRAWARRVSLSPGEALRCAEPLVVVAVALPIFSLWARHPGRARAARHEALSALPVVAQRVQVRHASPGFSCAQDRLCPVLLRLPVAPWAPGQVRWFAQRTAAVPMWMREKKRM